MADEATDDKPFLSRWSERKRAVQAEEAAHDGTPEPEERANKEQAAGQAELDANRAAAEAIDLEALSDASDYAPFFRPGVPLVLKNAALRKLWRSNPVFAVLDGLNDHDLDYRWPAKGSEVVKTAWKLGRGLLTSEDDAAKQARAARKAADDPTAERPAPQPDEKLADAGAEPAPSDPASAAGPVAEEDASPQSSGPEPDDLEPAKVSLSRRLDFAAFAKERGER